MFDYQSQMDSVGCLVRTAMSRVILQSKLLWLMQGYASDHSLKLRLK